MSLEVTQEQGGAQVASLWPWLHLLQLFLLLRTQGPRHKQSPGLSHTQGSTAPGLMLRGPLASLLSLSGSETESCKFLP